MSQYKLETLKLPQLTGMILTLMTWLIRFPITKMITSLVLLKDTGYFELRSHPIEEPPTMNPIWPNNNDADGSDPITSGSNKSFETWQTNYSIKNTEKNIAPTQRCFHSIRDYINSYQSDESTPSTVASNILNALEQEKNSSTSLNIFIQNNYDDIEQQAYASAERYRQGKPLSPLDGIPIAVKDEIDQEGYPTTVGTSFLGKTIANDDSTVVHRLRQAGALLIGKANMHEIGINPNSANVHYGTVRNPYNTRHEAGGSSSGSAAAVSAGFCPVSIGADGGGSIRIPAALCGMVGIKPTYGRVSEFGAAPLCWSVAHLGPIASSVEDTAYVLDVISGSDTRDPHSIGHPILDLSEFANRDLTGVRIGVYRPWFNHSSKCIVENCHRSLEVLEQAGAIVQEIEIPDLEFMAPAHAISILSEMNAAMHDHRNNFGNFGHSTQLNLGLAKFFSASDYLKAQRARTRSMNIFEQVLTKVDVIATPTTAVTAPLIPVKNANDTWSDLSATIELMRYAFPGNLTGLPAISIPVGYDENNLPIGLQLMGRAWEESLLIRIAGVAESTTSLKKPDRFYDLLRKG